MVTGVLTKPGLATVADRRRFVLSSLDGHFPKLAAGLIDHDAAARTVTPRLRADWPDIPPTRLDHLGRQSGDSLETMPL